MRSLLILVAALLFAPLVHAGSSEPLTVPAHGVIGVDAARLAPDYWIARAAHADKVLMSKPAIVMQNARVLSRDPSMHDLSAMPETLSRAQVLGWINDLSKLPDHALYGSDGRRIDQKALDALTASLDVDTVPASQPTRWGLVVHRARLRTFPTRLRVFSRPGNTDIDRFEETGVFPGTPVVIAHASRDGNWLFVISPRYAAWMEKDAVAEGNRDTVLDYGQTASARVITGAQEQTVFTPEQPALSQLKLDMGVRIPLAEGLPADAPVNGQSAYAAWTLRLPVRQPDGSLALKPALLQRVADSQGEYLPLTRANTIRQAFKFLGERYGWGHDYDGRDCSGFVSDVYRSMGVVMPRNTSAQSISPALEHREFGDDDDHAARMQAVGKLSIGDLVYIPGHVMMVIGKADGVHWVIHDTSGISYRQPDGTVRRIKLNAVSVTPLEPLLYNDHSSYIDHMTSIVHVTH